MIKKILITGGAGFIGYFLAKELAKYNYQIVIVDNFTRGSNDKNFLNLLNSKNIEILNINCLDQDSIMGLDKNFDYIFHLAAIIGVKHVNSDPYSVLEKNTLMVNNIIKLGKCQKNLSRLLFSSTSEVYAGTLENFNMQIPTPENTPLSITNLSRNRTSYMLSKIYGEAMCIHSDLPYTIFRPHNIYGPRMGMSHVIPEKLNEINSKNSGEIIHVASSKQTRCFCFIEDAVKLLLKILENDNCVNQTLNIGVSEPEISIGKLVEICCRVVGKDMILRGAEDTLGSPDRRAPDMNLTNKLVGKIKKTNLEQGIKKTFEWYKDNYFKNLI